MNSEIRGRDKEAVIGPTSHYFYSQRLKLHYVDWGNQNKPLLVLIHGSRDHARNWDWVAQVMREKYHVIAPDLRGHGDSQWAIGGLYAMVDYVLDLAQLLDAVGVFPVRLVGHSLGGAIALQYCGIYPERVEKVVAIEGLGPPPEMITKEPASKRMYHWIAQMQQLARRFPRRYGTIEEAVDRMRQANPHLSAAQARHLTLHGIARNEGGTYTWKFDNYVRALSPYSFNMKDAAEIWGRIICPVLLVRGNESWAANPEIDARASVFSSCRLVTIEGAGHWVHHDRLEEFIELVEGFLSA